MEREFYAARRRSILESFAPLDFVLVFGIFATTQNRSLVTAHSTDPCDEQKIVRLSRRHRRSRFSPNKCSFRSRAFFFFCSSKMKCNCRYGYFAWAVKCNIKTNKKQKRDRDRETKKLTNERIAKCKMHKTTNAKKIKAKKRENEKKNSKSKQQRIFKRSFALSFRPIGSKQAKFDARCECILCILREYWNGQQWQNDS